MKGLLDFTSGTSVYEVFKRICQQRGEGVALQAVAQMQQGHVVELTSALALSAASLSMKEHLPMADSVILATARAFRAVLWTQDKDFEGLQGVRYVSKTRRTTETRNPEQRGRG